MPEAAINLIIFDGAFDRPWPYVVLALDLRPFLRHDTATRYLTTRQIPQGELRTCHRVTPLKTPLYGRLAPPLPSTDVG